MWSRGQPMDTAMSAWLASATADLGGLMSDSRYGEVNDLMDKIIKFGAMRFEENSPAWGRKQGPSGHPHQLLGEEKELLEEIEKDLDELCATRRN